MHVSTDRREHHKRKHMNQEVLQQLQLMTREQTLALHLQKLRFIKVICWIISNKGYLEECSNITCNGLKQISHVAATVLRNVRLKQGVDIQVYK